MKKIIYAKGKRIVLIGTAHISQNSIELVKETIEKENPDLIAVELDRSRYEQLVHKKWKEIEIESIIKEGKLYLFLLTAYLSNMQKKMGSSLGIQPGSEFLEAIKIAKERKIPVLLADRDVSLTMKRAFSQVSLFEKLKLLLSFIASFFAPKEKLTKEKIEELKKEDILTKVISDLSTQFPSLKKVLVDERDSYLANQVLNSPFKNIVLIIGAGHLKGVEEKLRKPEPFVFSQKTKTKTKKTNLIGFAIPLLFLLAVYFTFSTKGLNASLSFLTAWFLLNGFLSAFFALLARAKPLTILASFLAAPFTSLSPFIAAGWVAAYIELKQNKPRVKDLEELNSLQGVSSFLENRITKTMVIAALVNLGSTIGTILSFAYLAKLL